MVKLFALLVKQQNKSCFYGIVTNSWITLGNAASPKAAPPPPPTTSQIKLQSLFSEMKFTTFATLQQ